ncbi:hypothetical protein JY651_34290 [Pyxidicoccus parkwayensis]|uniref:Uncharacterized protein n=1 Tax=Pyxidicoccus parkwayensis TaxID=2813578 RepID=A0ABX7NS27_9BACT|nr:hypothetical protein [Pyxidicoccus parkwaysis]QSQ20302.1 hypothetical protein JY651_34290 [Pyxidicoccus parkwaysis]
MAGLPLGTYVPALLIALFLALMTFALLRSRKNQHEAWKGLAARHDWTFSETPGAMEVQGLHQGRQLSLLTEKRGAGKHRHHVTVLRLDLGDVLGRDLVLEPEGLGDRFLKLFGRRDEETGDAELDAALDLKRVSPEVRALLRAPEVGRRLLALREQAASFSIVAGMLEVEHHGIPETLGALEARVAPALELADALSTARQQLRGRTSG